MVKLVEKSGKVVEMPQPEVKEATEGQNEVLEEIARRERILKFKKASPWNF